MELSLEEIGKIILHLDARVQDDDSAAELPELTPEDEAILERAWRVLAAVREPPAVSATMSDEETMRLFGLGEQKVSTLCNPSHRVWIRV
ncbi:MAG TPA: hypothetical protein PLP21_14270 [Pyrinomonadaceae bacterium]|nr:hypothetical protein [Pyrinomonadaceae bacterium]